MKPSNNSNSTYNIRAKAALETAQLEFDKGEFEIALRKLVEGFRQDVNYKPLYELAINCLDQLDGYEEQVLFENVVANFEQFTPFNDLGSHFYEMGHYDLAQPFLKKALEIDPTNDEVSHDLSISYARRFQIETALEVLENNEPGKEFWSYWFWCKLKILLGETSHVESGLKQLTDSLNQEANQDELDFPRKKVEELKDTLTRYNFLGDPAMHIQDWHFIQYGAVILDCFDDSEDYVAGGRFVASWGSKDSIKSICEALRLFLEQVGQSFESIKYMEDRDSTIIGLVLAKELDLPADVYNSHRPSEDCLIVAANSTDLDECPELSEIENGQLIFALNHCWLESAYISPDVIGFMTQSYIFPWAGGGYIMDKEVGASKKIAPDEREAPEIAAEIYAIESETTLTPEEIELFLTRKDYLKSIGTKTNAYRYNFMIESPVPGSYFG